MRFINSNLRLAMLGAISSYTGRAIGEAINNEYIEKNHKRIDISQPGYYSSVIAGAFAAPILEKTNLLNGVIFIVGLNKVVFDVVDRCAGNKGYDYNLLVKDFIFDAIAIYFIVLIIYRIIDVFNPNPENANNVDNGTNTNNITNPAGGEQESNILLDIEILIVVSIYYSIKANYIKNRNKQINCYDYIK